VRKRVPSRGPETFIENGVHSTEVAMSTELAGEKAG